MIDASFTETRDGIGEVATFFFHRQTGISESSCRIVRHPRYRGRLFQMETFGEDVK